MDRCSLKSKVFMYEIILRLQVQEAFAAAGPPLNAAGSINIGIVSAIKALSEPSPRQLKRMNDSGTPVSFVHTLPLNIVRSKIRHVSSSFS